MKVTPEQLQALIAVPTGEPFSEFPKSMVLNACAIDTTKRSILIVEDQPGYLELIGEAIAESFPQLFVQTARDGEQAWQLLEHCERRGDSGDLLLSDAAKNHRDVPLIYPSLIISDLNLPKLSGLELLKRVKQDPFLQAIPVVIFSTSSDEDDILRCYQAQANCYITKPRHVDEFFTVVQGMVAFWINVASLPNLTNP